MLKLKQIIPGMLASLSFAVVSSVEAATVVNPNNGNPVMSITDLEICISSADICAKTQDELEENEIKIIDSYDVTFLLGSFNDIFNNGDPTPPDFMGSCDIGLCFWEDETQAGLAITEINKAINGVSPIPSLVVGERVNLPDFVTNTSTLYRIPVRFGFDDLTNSNGIFSHQGTYNPDPDEPDPNDPGPWIFDTREELAFNGTVPAQLYTGFEFMGRQIITPEPPEPTQVPEPSSLMGIFFIGGSVVMAIQKKN